MPQQTAANKNNANQPVIFLDIDGVLGDFEGHAVQGDKMTPDGKLKYEALDYEWWVTMPPFKGAKAFYDEACKLGNTKFLTGPMLSEDCFAGKARWAETFVPERGNLVLADLIICRSVEKFYLANPRRILVDDRPSNIKAWEDAGGIGILHTGDYKDTMKRLREAVAKIEAAAKPSPAKKPAGHYRLPTMR